MNSSRIYLKLPMKQIRLETDVPVPCLPGSRITTLPGPGMFPYFPNSSTLSEKKKKKSAFNEWSSIIQNKSNELLIRKINPW